MSEITAGQNVGATLRQKLRVRFGKQKGAQALLLDVSGSMCGEPINRLREVADKFTQHRRFTFSDSVCELGPNQKVGDTEGGTQLDMALEHAKSLGLYHVVVVTDGRPDDEDAALTAAVGMQIDVLYVGPLPAPAFLNKLTNHTGGQYGEASLMTKEIESAIAGLIEAPAEKGPIQL